MIQSIASRFNVLEQCGWAICVAKPSELFRASIDYNIPSIVSKNLICGYLQLCQSAVRLANANTTGRRESGK
jgi:hypothetical protein